MSASPVPSLEQPWRIAVVGPGALGCLFAALLALDGHDVRLLGRRAAQADAINQHGLVVERDGVERRTTVRAGTDPAALGPVDLAIVLVKATDTAAAAPSLPALLVPDGPALSLQNGLGNVDALTAVLGPERVLGGITSQGATLLGDGRIRHAGFGPTSLAEATRVLTPRAQTIAALLDRAGLAATAYADPLPLIWGKLIANAAINPLGALLRCQNGFTVERPAARELFRSLAREAGAVATRLGVVLPFDDPAAHAEGVARITFNNRNSMLQDVEAGRRTEIDAINGAVARLGQEHGVPTPANATVAQMIRAVEQGYL
ncbi:MAG: 2-dehydropantoate 2-reductase [Chloroflexi bacterium]|nr:2-dehydropantoate 2-reductase [Chloroflexota bacterium]